MWTSIGSFGHEPGFFTEVDEETLGSFTKSTAAQWPQISDGESRVVVFPGSFLADCSNHSPKNDFMSHHVIVVHSLNSIEHPGWVVNDIPKRVPKSVVSAQLRQGPALCAPSGAREGRMRATELEQKNIK